MTIHINRTEHLECIARAAASSITHLPKGNASAQSAVCRVWATPSAVGRHVRCQPGTVARWISWLLP